MMKTLKSLRDEAERKMVLWNRIADDKEALQDRNKTREDALMLVNYFEGKFDAYCDAIGMVSDD